MISREETIKTLEQKQKQLMTMYQGYLEYGGEPLREHENWLYALNMATESLKKQIPQKPTYEGDGYADVVLVYDTWICPNCEKRYEVDYDEYDHCPACGQAIDWSDSNG